MDGEIYVWQSCVEINGCPVKSSSPRSKWRIVELQFLVSPPFLSRFFLYLQFSFFFFIFLSLFLPPLSPHTQLDEYIALCREDIYIEIAVSELTLLHSLLLKYKEDIVSLSAPHEVHPPATLGSSPSHCPAGRCSW